MAAGGRSSGPTAGGSRALDLGTASAVSFAGHAILALALVSAVRLAQLGLFDDEPREPRRERRPAAASEELTIELVEARSPSELRAALDAERAAIELPSGGSLVARVDDGRAGRGGDDTVPEKALNLADQNDGLTRMHGSLTHLDVSQLPRIDTHRERRSLEDLRSSREPRELTFVAMGKLGVLEERRREAKVDPGAGLAWATPRNRAGGELGAAPEPTGAGAPKLLAGTDQIGGPIASPGLGAKRARDAGPESSALVNAHARPLVFHADPSVPSLEEGKPGDDVEDEQSVAARMAALLHASTSGGAKLGQGKGGEAGPGAVGAGGAKGAGQSSSPAGGGGSGPPDLERIGYIRSVQVKVHPHWANAFPKWAALEGRGGSAVIAFTIEADGTVSSARVARSSGIAEFDENVRKAVFKGRPSASCPRRSADASR
ncbi:MAG: energy transducer TonB [Polyangiaceae bacterium]|nr:energy transducer TonB [Polyangiaceae bacterium]